MPREIYVHSSAHSTTTATVAEKQQWQQMKNRIKKKRIETKQRNILRKFITSVAKSSSYGMAGIGNTSKQNRRAEKKKTKQRKIFQSFIAAKSEHGKGGRAKAKK